MLCVVCWLRCVVCCLLHAGLVCCVLCVMCSLLFVSFSLWVRCWSLSRDACVLCVAHWWFGCCLLRVGGFVCFALRVLLV